jgi:hypothetical protein
LECWCAATGPLSSSKSYVISIFFIIQFHLAVLRN